jgi:RNA recognition motif-containing protein
MSGVVLRLEGLPFKVTSEEITDFFTETEAKITTTYLLLNRDMRPSGIGYIELESEADVKLALTLDGKCIGDSKRYVRMGEWVCTYPSNTPRRSSNLSSLNFTFCLLKCVLTYSYKS